MLSDGGGPAAVACMYTFRFLVWAELFLVWAELLLLCPLHRSVACVCYCPDSIRIVSGYIQCPDSIRIVSGYFSFVCAIDLY